jgi:hypothetical protein
MTEQLDDLDDLALARPEPTGVPRVDAVLDAVAAVGDRPVDEQVAVFEQAHAELRSTLDDPDVDTDAPPA